MRFYKTQHSYYCGIDLHARSMFTHILPKWVLHHHGISPLRVPNI